MQVYRELDELVESVAEYLASGFERGEPAIVIATKENLRAFLQRLATTGYEPGRLESDGLLTVHDAEATLAAIMPDGYPSSGRFEETVGGAIDTIAAQFPQRRIRAFGEMVDLLVARGEPDAADSLEELWNSLARAREFSLLCGYHLDVFDRSAQAGALRDLCRTHSHVLPAASTARLSRAVDQALEEVLGQAEAGKIYVVVGDELSNRHVPAPQLVLMWIAEHMPSLADRIFAVARSRYDAALPA